MLQCRLHMAAKKAIKQEGETEAKELVSRVYEVGYHITPEAKEDDLEAIVAGIRSIIEKAGGTFIAEAAPSLMKLAYEIPVRVAGKIVMHDRAYFGWIKLEASTEAAAALEAALKVSKDVIRFIVFRTLREDTRAHIKPPTLREVKRTDTIKAAPRRTEESPATPVSEEDLDKALDVLTTE